MAKRTKPPVRRRKTGGSTEVPVRAEPESSPRDENAPGAGRDERGRFAQGNEFGAENRWKPGQSGNPKGKPSKFQELRDLIQEIGNEEIRGHPQRWTQLERMLRQMLFSKNATDHQNILEFGWGKVPTEQTVKIEQEQPILVKVDR